jgi:hypothetical protein
MVGLKLAFVFALFGRSAQAIPTLIEESEILAKMMPFVTLNKMEHE